VVASLVGGVGAAAWLADRGAGSQADTVQPATAGATDVSTLMTLRGAAGLAGLSMRDVPRNSYTAMPAWVQPAQAGCRKR
jgi:hypothetical protein